MKKLLLWVLVMVMLVASVTASSTLDANLSAAYTLEEGSGAVINKMYNKYPNGTLEGVATLQWAGANGYGYNFAAGNIDIASNLGLSATTGTMCAWVNFTNTSLKGVILAYGNTDTALNGLALGVGGSTFDNTGNDIIVWLRVLHGSILELLMELDCIIFVLCKVVVKRYYIWMV